MLENYEICVSVVSGFVFVACFSGGGCCFGRTSFGVGLVPFIFVAVVSVVLVFHSSTL